MTDKQLKKMEELMILMELQDAIPLLYVRELDKKLLNNLKFM